jgi:ATP-dependent helicase/nuclease subunit B
MFPPISTPRVFALPPGADFPAGLVAGLISRSVDQAPERLARAEIFVNTQRMQRRVKALFIASGARLLPRIKLISDLGATIPIPDLPPPISPLRRRLELSVLVDKLLTQQPDLAPRSALYALSDSLATLLDEMQGEGVAPDVLAKLDVSDHSKHWDRALKFVALVEQFFTPDAPDKEARQRLVVERLIANWAIRPPSHPVIIAGSTGSRGTTARLMQAVGQLPQGALVLPGFDFDMPPDIWAGLGDALAAEDHPQFRFHTLLRSLRLSPADVQPWSDTAAPNSARNSLVSLALRPAPVTDQWMSEGRQLIGLADAAQEMTLIEAPSPRMEALAIALRLRKAAQDGQIAALISPDRMLTRQVTAALDRWRLVPDDSAGRPLSLSAPGRFLRHIAALRAGRITTETLLVVLKHPLTHSASNRGEHLRHTRDLELYLRRNSLPFPNPEELRVWGGANKCPDWTDWLASALPEMDADTPCHMTDLVTSHLALAEKLASGPDNDSSGELWLEAAGIEARAAMNDLADEAGFGGTLSPFDYTAFVSALLSAREVRSATTGHPHIMIWGTLEARVQGADLVILGGLNDGIWPQSPSPDPWLNRKMRFDAGLLLPERRIGLSAHDFQQAIGAREIVLSRAVRNSETQTVPSRWLNRLTNLMGGLPEQGGKAALKEMRARGKTWVEMAQTLEADFGSIPAEMAKPAPRPAPCPPLAARPRELPVTAVRTLIRDPFAVYARYVLRLRKLNPLHPSPDMMLRGQVLHKVVEKFVLSGCDPDSLMPITDDILAAEVPWPAARVLWRARMARAADWFIATNAALPGAPVLLEDHGVAAMPSLNFELTARPDRIDEWPDGRLHILDYKTGTPPTPKQQEFFDKQLLLEAAMAERGAFKTLGPREVARISYIGLGAAPKLVETELTPEDNAKTWADFQSLIASYQDPNKGFAARRAVQKERFVGDYDHLARLGEWDLSFDAELIRVGVPEGAE